MKPHDELWSLGQRYLEERRFGEAEAIARQALEQDPQEGRFWRLAGMASWALEAFDRARVNLENACSLAPLCPMSWLALADCYVRLGKIASAQGIYRMLADSDRFPTSLLPRLATGLGRIEEYRLALGVCRKLAKRHANHHGAFFGMAYYLSRLGYPQRSCLLRLRQAFRLAPDMLLYRVNLACVCADLGRFRAAHRLIRDLDPESVPCACWLRRLVRVFEGANDPIRGQSFAAVLARRSSAH